MSNPPSTARAKGGVVRLLRRQLREAEVRYAKLEGDRVQLLRGNAAQGRLLEAAQQARHRLEEQLTALQGQQRALAEARASQDAQLAEQQAQMADLRQRLADHPAVSTQLEHVTRARDALASELQAVKGSRARLEGELEAARAEISSQMASLNARAGEVTALLARTAAAEARNRDLEQEASARQATIAELQAQAEGFAALQGQFLRLETDYRTLQTELAAKEEELQTARQGLRESIATMKAAQRLSGTLEWKSTLDRVLAAASERIAFQRGTLLLLDEVQSELKVEAALNSPIAVSEMSRFRVGEGVAGRVVEQRRGVLIPDTQSDPRFKLSDPSHEPRSVVAVPLVAGEEVLGVLSLVRPAGDPFTEADLKAAESVGEDAARALNNARLYHVLKEREGRLEALVQRAWDLNASLEPKQVLSSIIRGAQQLAGGGAALVALMDTESYELDVVAADQIPQSLLAGPGTAWGRPVARDVVRTGKPWVAPMSEIVPANQRPVLEDLGMQYLISIPMRSSDALPSPNGPIIMPARTPTEESAEIHGVLNLYRTETTPVPAELLAALLAFGNQAAQALKNVRRWERLTQEKQTAQALNARLMGRERFIAQLQLRIGQLEKELTRWRS